MPDSPTTIATERRSPLCKPLLNAMCSWLPLASSVVARHDRPSDAEFMRASCSLRRTEGDSGNHDSADLAAGNSFPALVKECERRSVEGVRDGTPTQRPLRTPVDGSTLVTWVAELDDPACSLSLVLPLRVDVTLWDPAVANLLVDMCGADVP